MTEKGWALTHQQVRRLHKGIRDIKVELPDPDRLDEDPPGVDEDEDNNPEIVPPDA